MSGSPTFPQATQEGEGDNSLPKNDSHESPAKPVAILLVDDDVELCTSLTKLLDMDGFRVTAVHDAAAGVKEGLKANYELIILDVMLPGGDGRKVLRRIRMKSRIPVIMLTARGDEADRIAGLEAGADDYLPKPFSVRELVARMRAVLSRGGTTPLPEIHRLGDIEIQLKSRAVLQHGIAIELTGAEYDILLLLMQSAGKVLSREEIAEAALGRPIGMLDRSIDNHVSSLRKKLGPRLGKVERIQNVRGTGYVYSGQSQADKK